MMRTKSLREQYEESLNNKFDTETTLELTEHCWAGNDKNTAQKKSALKYANRGLYGTVLRKFDKIAFNVGFNEWKRG